MEYGGAAWSLMPSLPMSSDNERIPSPDEVLTIRDLAALLKLAEKTVYSMANGGELPAFKIRGQWRVRREDIVVWLQQKAEKRSPANEQNS